MYTFTPEDESTLKRLEEGIDTLLKYFEDTPVIEMLRHGYDASDSELDRTHALATVTLYIVAKNMGISPSELIKSYYREELRLLKELNADT